MSLMHPFILTRNNPDSRIDNVRLTVLRARQFHIAATDPYGRRVLDLLGYRYWGDDCGLLAEDNNAEKARGEARYDEGGGESGNTVPGQWLNTRVGLPGYKKRHSC
jgi:hypothetical protein